MNRRDFISTAAAVPAAAVLPIMKLPKEENPNNLPVIRFVRIGAALEIINATEIENRGIRVPEKESDDLCDLYKAWLKEEDWANVMGERIWGEVGIRITKKFNWIVPIEESHRIVKHFVLMRRSS